MLELVARHLRTMNDPKLQVIQASDGEEAWRLARAELPDLVVLDVMMPGMSGWEVCRKIREDIALAHTGVVMLTGIGENLNQMTSPLYGADAYIDKPFEFDDFDAKVRDTLRAREGQRSGVLRPTMNGTSGGAAHAEAPTPKHGAKEKAASKAPTKAKKASAAKPSPKKAPAKTKKASAAKPSPKKAPAKTKKAPAAKPSAKKAPAKTKKAPATKPSAKKAPAKTKKAAKPSKNARTRTR